MWQSSGIIRVTSAGRFGCMTGHQCLSGVLHSLLRVRNRLAEGILGIHPLQMSVFAKGVQRESFCYVVVCNKYKEEQPQRPGRTITDVLAQVDSLLNLHFVRQVPILYGTIQGQLRSAATSAYLSYFRTVREVCRENYSYGINRLIV
jgi:hypothetical protein